MGIFANMMAKIFNKDAQAAPASSGASQPAKDPASATSGSAKTAQGSAEGASGKSPAGMQQVDVEAVLTAMAAKSGQKLDWRKSIVDLMKLMGLDSSATARKELAKELNYTGDMNDSAKMNVWLHKQVMTKFAENGGKVPEELRT